MTCRNRVEPDSSERRQVSSVDVSSSCKDVDFFPRQGVEEERPGWADPPRPLLAVPNVTAHPSTVPIKGLTETNKSTQEEEIEREAGKSPSEF